MDNTVIKSMYEDLIVASWSLYFVEYMSKCSMLHNAHPYESSYLGMFYQVDSLKDMWLLADDKENAHRALYEEGHSWSYTDIVTLKTCSIQQNILHNRIIDSQC